MPVLTKINTNSIAEDAITGDKFAGDAYLSNTANQNISGTYSENRLYTSDAYTLSGNATVNSNITLSTVKSTGDVVLTAGGAYTITGTGVLSGGSLLAKERSDLTGMTGELGSVVIGAPALTGLGTVTSGTYNASIGSTATFPAGHIIQIVQDADDTAATSSDDTWLTAISKSITLSNNTNKILAIGTARGELDRSAALSQGGIRMESSSSGTDQTVNHNTGGSGAEPYGLTGYGRWAFSYTMTYIFEPNYQGAVTITMKGRRHNSNSVLYINRAGTDPNNTFSQILLMEIAAT